MGGIAMEYFGGICSKNSGLSKFWSNREDKNETNLSCRSSSSSMKLC